jgi:hypothetical protein
MNKEIRIAQFMNEEQQELNPPSPDRVARRALILSAIICRSGIEKDAGNPQAEAFRQQVVEWVERLGLDSEAEPLELEILRKSIGELSERQRIDCGWQAEALAVLAWALGKYELPNYDVQVAGPDIADALGFMEEKASTFLHRPRLRPLHEITILADQLFALHWRLRQFSHEQSAMDFHDFARTASFGPLDIDGLRLIENDLAIQDVPVFKRLNSGGEKP